MVILLGSCYVVGKICIFEVHKGGRYMEGNRTLLLKQSEVESLIDLSDVNRLVDLTFHGMGEGTVKNPPKVSLDLGETGNWPHYEGFMNAMPAYIGSLDVAGLKWVGGFEGEREAAGLPYITAMILLVNPHLGTFLSVMDGAYISNVRTGAQVAQAIRYLFRKDHITLGLYGAGMQARKTVRAVADAVHIDCLHVWNHREETAQQFKEDMAEVVHGEIIVHEVSDQAGPCQAEVVVTLTPAQEPLIRREWVQSGTVIFPMGSYQEIDDALILEADQIIVDHPEQALHRGALKKLHTNGQITLDDIDGTLGELSLKETGLANIDKQITLCIPIGTGAMDVSVAYEVYRKAKEAGVGEYFDFVG